MANRIKIRQGARKRIRGKDRSGKCFPLLRTFSGRRTVVALLKPDFSPSASAHPA